jgi:hypothetical protein
MAPQFDTYHITLILVALITGVISPVVLQLTKFFLLKLSSPKNQYKDTFKDESKITKKLESLSEKYNADRVWIAEFHNGEIAYSGKSLQKFSETHEEVKQGISSEALNTQSIPTSVFVRFFNELNTKGYYFLKNVEDLNGSDLVGIALESFLTSRNIKSYLTVAIKNIKNDFIGILCLDGVNKSLEINEKDIQDITYSAASLAGYLEGVD